MGRQIAMVDYLVIDDGAPHLVAHRCESCAALYFDRRVACARCGGTQFGSTTLATRGTVRAFTIVHRSAPSVPAPFVSAVIDLDGGGVIKANLRDVAPEPGEVKLGMPVELTTFVAGTDSEGTEAVAFAFAPVREGSSNG
jgi:uncharacterized OB-fold protein